MSTRRCLTMEIYLAVVRPLANLFYLYYLFHSCIFLFNFANKDSWAFKNNRDAKQRCPCLRYASLQGSAVPTWPLLCWRDLCEAANHNWPWRVCVVHPRGPRELRSRRCRKSAVRHCVHCRLGLAELLAKFSRRDELRKACMEAARMCLS